MAKCDDCIERIIKNVSLRHGVSSAFSVIDAEDVFDFDEKSLLAIVDRYGIDEATDMMYDLSVKSYGSEDKMIDTLLSGILSPNEYQEWEDDKAVDAADLKILEDAKSDKILAKRLIKGHFKDCIKHFIGE